MRVFASATDIRPSRMLLFLLVVLLCTTGAGAELTLLTTIPLNDFENGRDPWGIAFSATRGRAYVACIEGPAHLMVIDAESGTIADRLPLTGMAPHGICFNADESRLFVANFGGSVSFIDPAIPEELFTVALDGAPVDLCCHRPAGSPEALYVTEMYGGRVFVCDAETGALRDTIAVGAYPYNLCLNHATERLYVANLSDGTVSVIDATVDTVLTTIAVNDYPIGIACDEELDLIYVCHRDDNTVGVIDGATQTLTALYPVGASPRNVVVDPITHRVFVVNAESNDVTVLLPEGPTGESVGVGLLPSGGIAVDAMGGEVYVTNAASQDVTRFRVAPPWQTLTVRLRFTAGSVVLCGITEPPFPVYIADAQGDDMVYLETSTGAYGHSLTCGYAPVDLATRNSDHLLTVLSAETNRALLFDSTSGTPLDTFRVGEHPTGIACRDDSPEIYVANWDSGSLTIINTDLGLVTDTIQFTGGPVLDVAVSKSADRIYASRWNGLVHILDGTTHATIDSIHVSGFYEVNRLAVDDARRFIYAAALNANIVWVISDQDHAVIGTVPVGGIPSGVAVNAELGHAYACAGDEIVQIGPNHTIQATLTLPGEVERCSADPLTHRVYVTGNADGGGYLAIVLDGNFSALPESPLPVAQLRLQLQSGHPISGAESDVHLLLENRIPARLTLHGLDGRQLQDLSPRTSYTPGRHRITWNQRDDSGRQVPTGTYFLRAQTADGTATSLRLVLMR